jgi:tetraacyldisaccharide 4'-kinase
MSILEKVYLFFYGLKKKKAIKNQKKLPFPVISIGNLTVGGTGKTPFTVALAKELEKKGYRTIILTRGYRGRLKRPVIVKEYMNAEDVGDEPLMMVMEGFTVVKAINRYVGGVYAIEKLCLTEKDRVIFILDDGFQHWQLQRNLNILLIDGYRGFDNQRLLPLGSLRSPLEEIIEADMVFITKRENESLKREIQEKGFKNLFFSPLSIKGIFSFEGKKITPVGQKVYAFAGIGNFEGFLNSLKSLNLEVVGYKKFIDHKIYSEKLLKKINSLASEAQLVITTKKDFVKIGKHPSLTDKFCYLDISLEIDSSAMQEIVRKIS